MPLGASGIRAYRVLSELWFNNAYLSRPEGGPGPVILERRPRGNDSVMLSSNWKSSQSPRLARAESVARLRLVFSCKLIKAYILPSTKTGTPDANQYERHWASLRATNVAMRAAEGEPSVGTDQCGREQIKRVQLDPRRAVRQNRRQPVNQHRLRHCEEKLTSRSIVASQKWSEQMTSSPLCELQRRAYCSVAQGD